MRNCLKAPRDLRTREIAFRPAVTPLEAAVIPAGERMRYGVLSMAPRAYEALQRRENQRAKIWVR